jgi:hypothetical protein
MDETDLKVDFDDRTWIGVIAHDLDMLRVQVKILTSNVASAAALLFLLLPLLLLLLLQCATQLFRFS